MFDYTELSPILCQYEGPVLGEWGEVEDCGATATHCVWWQEDGKDAMNVCKNHFKFIRQCEAAEDGSGTPPKGRLG